jgi:tetratricopeptide (TPR) repeat protein
VPKEKIVDGWNSINDGRGLDALQAYLVRQIRLWRPEVIVTNDLPRGEHAVDAINGPLHELVHEATVRAVAQAADPNAFPEQITQAGLKPWAVQRIFAAVPVGVRGTVEESTEQFSRRFGCSLAEAAAEPRGLIEDDDAEIAPIRSFRLIQSSLPQDAPTRDIFSGMAITPGGPARRLLSASSVEGINVKQRIDQKRRHVQAILEHAGRTAGSMEPLLAQIDELGRDLDDPSRGRILFQLADRYDRTGHWTLAAETFQLLAERYPQHTRSPQALLWLLQYNASSEAARRVEQGDPKSRFEQAIQISERIEQAQPEMFSEPALCFPLAAAYRGIGQPRRAEQLLRLHSATMENKPTLDCIATVSRPHLDGVLDDATWAQAKAAVLQSAQHDDSDWPAAVLMAHDAEFLYVAIRCKMAGPESTAGVTMPRPRDGDLSAYDRVDIFLDVDRDFTTFDRLTIDRRGWTNDVCWHDATWNPRWFVAVKQESGQWTAEAAIPLVELVSVSPTPGTTWAIGIQRTAPNIGFQSWSAPAAVRVLPEGFGQLVFR